MLRTSGSPPPAVTRPGSRTRMVTGLASSAPTRPELPRPHLARSRAPRAHARLLPFLALALISHHDSYCGRGECPVRSNTPVAGRARGHVPRRVRDMTTRAQLLRSLAIPSSPASSATTSGRRWRSIRRPGRMRPTLLPSGYRERGNHGPLEKYFRKTPAMSSSARRPPSTLETSTGLLTRRGWPGASRRP